MTGPTGSFIGYDVFYFAISLTKPFLNQDETLELTDWSTTLSLV